MCFCAKLLWCGTTALATGAIAERHCHPAVPEQTERLWTLPNRSVGNIEQPIGCPEIRNGTRYCPVEIDGLVHGFHGTLDLCLCTARYVFVFHVEPIISDFKYGDIYHSYSACTLDNCLIKSNKYYTMSRLVFWAKDLGAQHFPKYGRNHLYTFSSMHPNISQPFQYIFWTNLRDIPSNILENELQHNPSQSKPPRCSRRTSFIAILSGYESSVVQVYRSSHIGAS